MRVIFATGPVGEKGGTATYASVLAERFIAKGIESRTVPYTSLELSIPIGIRHLVYFCRLLVPILRADVVLAFDTWSVGVPSLLAAKLLRKPFVVRVGGDFLWEHYVERTGDIVKLSEIYNSRKSKFNIKERVLFRGTRLLLKHADLIAFNSRWQIDLWRRAYDVPLSQAVVIENAYPPRKESIAPNKKNFVAAGRLVKLKQEKMLKELFKEITQEYPEAELDTEHLSKEEHQRRVRSCYAVVLASVSDVAPNVIVDAIAHGKPFVCTSDTGITERVGGLGYFVDTQDKETLKGAIISLLDEKTYNEKKKQIEEFSFTRSWDQVADEFLINIQKCMS